MDGVTVTSAGDIRVAPRLTPVAQTTVPYFWSLAQGTDGTIYAGSGDDGAVYQIGADGKATAWAKTGELEVLSLLRATDGSLYAGTAPHGRIFRISADGKATLAFDTKDRYVLAMAASPDGATIYAATGGATGRVYALPASATGASTALLAPLYSGSEGSVTALAVAADGSVYAGTAPNGLVLKVAGPGVAAGYPKVLFDSKEASISGLTLGVDGTLYAATAPHGTVLRVDPTGGATTRVLYDRQPNGGGSLIGLLTGADGLLYTASGSAVIVLDPATGTTRTFDPAADIQILSLLRGASGGLLVGTGNTASVYRLGGGDGTDSGTATAAVTTPATGRFTSSVLDTQTTTHWGTIRWAGDTPAPAAVTLETRTGSTPEPDATWSGWSRDYADASGETIVSPPARFLQYRATLTGGAVLNGVDVFYLTPNQPPQVTLLAPRGGDIVRGATTIRWSGTDPDRDTLAYSLALSADNGKTWQPLTEPGTVVARAAAPPPPMKIAGGTTVMATIPATGGGSTSTTAADLAAQLAQHPEISPEMRARILADAPPVTAPVAATVTMAAPAPAPTVSSPTAGVRGNDWTLDTAAYQDGLYRVRVIGTDRPSNPTGALTSEKVSPAFRIANHPPSIVLFRATYTATPNGARRLEGIALHPSVAIRGVQFRVDGGEWMAAAADDGIFDSSSEGFSLTTAPMSAGTHTLEVQAIDEAGNAVTVKREIR